MELDSLVDPSIILKAVAEIKIPDNNDLNNNLDLLTERSGWISSKTMESTMVRYVQFQNTLQERNAELKMERRLNKQQQKKVKEQQKQIEELQANMTKILEKWISNKRARC